MDLDTWTTDIFVTIFDAEERNGEMWGLLMGYDFLLLEMLYSD